MKTRIFRVLIDSFCCAVIVATCNVGYCQTFAGGEGDGYGFAGVTCGEMSVGGDLAGSSQVCSAINSSTYVKGL